MFIPVVVCVIIIDMKSVTDASSTDCCKTFDSNKISMNDASTDTQAWQHRCKDCGKPFNQEYKVKGHQLQHTEEETQYQCAECGKSFAQSCCQVQEQTGERIFSQEHCMERCQSVHDGERLYTCYDSGKSCITGSKLK